MLSRRPAAGPALIPGSRSPPCARDRPIGVRLRPLSRPLCATGPKAPNSVIKAALAGVCGKERRRRERKQPAESRWLRGGGGPCGGGGRGAGGRGPGPEECPPPPQCHLRRRTARPSPSASPALAGTKPQPLPGPCWACLGLQPLSRARGLSGLRPVPSPGGPQHPHLPLAHVSDRL